MNLRRYLIALGRMGALSNSLMAMNDNPQTPADFPCVVVFGRPGAGKTTVADAAVKAVIDDEHLCLGLDLDICVPNWMKENFARGIYPTLEQRGVFAMECCDYVENQVAEKIHKGSEKVASIISFSFVNQDLRDVFRSRFPNAKWVLIDTSEEEANVRINQREDHFYKGELTTEEQETTPENQAMDVDNSDWKFAPVPFDHVVLDGRKPVEENAKKVVEVLQEVIKLQKQ